MEGLFWIVISLRIGLALTMAFLFGVFWNLLFSKFDKMPLQSGLLFAAIYIAASAFAMIVNLVSGIAYNKFIQNRIIRDAFLDELRRSAIPFPRRNDPRRFDYILSIAEDESIDANTRVKCAIFHATNEAHIGKSGFFNSITMRRAMDDAVLRFSQEAPSEFN